MLKRCQMWTEANPLWNWMLSVAVWLAFSLTVFFVVPGPKTPGLVLLPMILIALTGPTHSLTVRLSEAGREARPVSPSQERGVGLLAVLAFVCSIGTFGVCLFGARMGWPMGRVGGMLIGFSVSTLLSLRLGYAARHTAAGRWGMRLTSGWLVLMLSAVLVMTLRHVFLHS